jgi:hypothetical protein
MDRYGTVAIVDRMSAPETTIATVAQASYGLSGKDYTREESGIE